MLFGAHLLLYSRDVAADQAFLRDVLGLAAVALGDGRLALALPPAEAALHPDGAGTPRAVPPVAHGGRALLGAALYLTCDDLDAALRQLTARGAAHTAVTDEPWGRKTTVVLPSGGELGLYAPAHPVAVPREAATGAE